ncbi:MAG: right-handed parallel beta-helix repeat-containing protein [Methylococcales bacterium]|nr:right-handed parallel beta-helix repeat-containing protein [Methylococcales bacterium]
MKIIIQNRIAYKLFFIVCIQCLLVFQQAYAATYYVSPTGNDTNSGTSLSAPVRTIKNALSKAKLSGDTIYMLTGTYAEAIWIGSSGITLTAYPNNTPVIDGGTTLPGSSSASLLGIGGDYNTVSGFEIKNSNILGNYVNGIGIFVRGNHNTISNMKVHDTWSNGIIIHGDYGIVENSIVQDTVLRNYNGVGGGWDSGLSVARNPSASALIPGIASYGILRHNIVHNNWGEGLSCYEADHCTIEDNVIYNNWALNLYLSDITNSLVQRNIIYISSPQVIPNRGNMSFGLAMADEVSTVPRSANNTVINNFIYNAIFQAFSWTLVPNSGLKNVLIANNTIVDGGLFTGNGGSQSIVNTNSRIQNNIITGNNSKVPSNSGITFSNNNWSTTPPLAASSTDVVGDPQIARTGTTTQGTLIPDYFKISSESSPVIDAALPINKVTKDFFQVVRGTYPDIGGHEFVSN